MKKIINIAAISLTLLLFASCQDELKDELFHKFSYLVKNGWKEYTVDIKEDNTAELLIDFGINGTSANDKDITVTIANDPDTLAAYNFEKFKLQTSSYYLEFPTEYYSFDQEFYTIPKGESKTTAKVHIDLSKIQNIYNDYVLPLKITSSTGEAMGPSKYCKLLANLIFRNKFSGGYAGSGKITVEGTSQSTSVGSVKLYAVSPRSCFMYAANANQDTDPNYKQYAIDIVFDENENITLSSKNDKLQLEPVTASLSRKYVKHATDTRYYIQTSVLKLKYKYKDQAEAENRMIIYEGTHTQTMNVLRSEYPHVKVDEE